MEGCASVCLVQAVDPVFANYPEQTFGSFILSQRSLFQDPSFYWIGVGTLAAYVVLFNLCLATVVLRFLNPLGQPQPLISEDSIQDRHAARTGEMAGKSKGEGGSSRASARASGRGSGLDKFRGSSNSERYPFTLPVATQNLGVDIEWRADLPLSCRVSAPAQPAEGEHRRWWGG